MKISYNWLKQYINIDLTPDQISKILTDTGLEVESVELFETIKGGLEGIVVGKVLSCEKHPGADKLSKTTVDVGDGKPTPIVCGAPNVAAGQTVLVATVGTTLYNGDESFQIKKAKIRGEESEGMICAEDELGLGTSHDGIMVLPNQIEAGTPAKEYFSIESDFVFEIGLTPNRADAASHIGTARDIAAFLNQETSTKLDIPSVEHFKVDNVNTVVEVVVEDAERCPRYTGLTISGLHVTESPKWLKARLQSIGLKPINNVVDVTNYILHEFGQPLHAFDLDAVGNKIIVKTLADKSKFVTLDNIERELSDEDLMICNENEAMCIGGVFGGAKSGVKNTTTSIFLESAYFNPVSVRKSSKRHALQTDASFRFERGVDPNNTVYVLKRAAMLIKDIAGGTISSEIIDTNPEGVAPFEICVSYKKIDSLIGKSIDRDLIKRILTSLDIVVDDDVNDELYLLVPPYRVDVQRPEDVVEEILRIYGYNNVEIPTQINASLIVQKEVDEHAVWKELSSQLVGAGFTEIMNNSLTKSSYYEKYNPESVSSLVNILNYLSTDLNVMRQSLLFGGLESILYNINRKRTNLRMFEFGRTYKVNAKEDGLDKYEETHRVGLFMTGDFTPKSWNSIETDADFFFLKSYVELILKKLGVKNNSLSKKEYSDRELTGQQYSINNKELVRFGIVSSAIRKGMGIDNAVYFADMNWSNLISVFKQKTLFAELPKILGVKRDLSMLVDTSVGFAQIEEIAYKTDKKLIKNVGIFDIYQGKGIPEGKKSYAVSFFIQNDDITLTDSEIEKVMNKLIGSYKHQLGAELR